MKKRKALEKSPQDSVTKPKRPRRPKKDPSPTPRVPHGNSGKDKKNAIIVEDEDYELIVQTKRIREEKSKPPAVFSVDPIEILRNGDVRISCSVLTT